MVVDGDLGAGAGMGKCHTASIEEAVDLAPAGVAMIIVETHDEVEMLFLSVESRA